MRAGRSLPPLSAGGLVAAWSGDVEVARVERMLARVDGWRALAPQRIPTCDPSAPEFDAERYWRGPVWVLVNWLVAEGVAFAGDDERASSLRRATLALVEQDGFSEYYDARTGAGIGGRAFSWSAALTLSWLTADTP